MNDKTKKLLDDCVRPACDDMQSMFQQAAAAATTSAAASSTGGSTTIAATKGNPTTYNREQSIDCPAGSAELGRSSWTLLHSMAAWYPDQPSKEDQTQMTAFMSSLARFYPCTWCATDFQKNITKTPVPTESREKLCQWVCYQHNLVNEKKGKSLFACDMTTLDDRWRQSNRTECKNSYLYHGDH